MLSATLNEDMSLAISAVTQSRKQKYKVEQLELSNFTGPRQILAKNVWRLD